MDRRAAEVLADNKQDAVIVLRLGAFANSVQGILMRFVACLQEPDSTASERDRMMLFFAGAGYMKEAVDHIQKNQVRLRQLLNVARESGYPLTTKWTEMEDLLTTKAGSVSPTHRRCPQAGPDERGLAGIECQAVHRREKGLLRVPSSLHDSRRCV